MSADTDTRTEIVHHMARAFFACAWADWADEYGPGTAGNGVDVMTEMPDELDPSAVWAAFKLADALEKQHGMHTAEIYRKAREIAGDDGDRDKSPEMFGHYAAMGAMGHGVSLYDAFGQDAAEFVNTSDCQMEFSPFDLCDGRFHIPELEDTRTPEQKAKDAEILTILAENLQERAEELKTEAENTE